jgi:hypothetical protein
MHSFLKWLMVFCVMAGVSARAVTADAGRLIACSQVSDHCCGDHHSEIPEKDHHDDSSCPLGDHHHHHCCSSAQPLAMESLLTCRLSVPQSLLIGIRHESEIAPEEPFLGSEKPPLI